MRGPEFCRKQEKPARVKDYDFDRMNLLTLTQMECDGLVEVDINLYKAYGDARLGRHGENSRALAVSMLVTDVGRMCR